MKTMISLLLFLFGCLELALANSSTDRIVSISSMGLNICVATAEKVTCRGSNTDGEGGVFTGFKDIKKVVSGNYHNCALEESGLWCWGTNNQGQTNVPGGLVDVREVIAGTDFTCAIDSQAIQCWGRVQFQIFGEKFRSIAAGGKRVCAIIEKTVHCWDENGKELSIPEGITHPIQLAMTLSYLCVLEGIDQKTRIRCWKNGVEEVVKAFESSDFLNITGGDGNICAWNSSKIKCLSERTFRVRDVKMVTAGHINSCVVADKEFYCRDYENKKITFPPKLPPLRQVALGDASTCGLSADSIQCWGRKDPGQTEPPRGVSSQAQIVNLGQGEDYCVLDGGVVRCWGLKDETLSFQSPQMISSLGGSVCALEKRGIVCSDGQVLVSNNSFQRRKVTQMVGGYGGLCVNESGKVQCWKQGIKQKIPSEIAALKIDAIAVNYGQACVISSQNIYCWNYNETNWKIEQPPTGLKADLLTAGWNYFCAGTKDHIQCWGGDNQYGNLDVPKGLINVQSLQANTNHVCAVHTNGRLTCWGANFSLESTPPDDF